MYSIEVTPAADCDLNKLKDNIQRGDFERLRAAIRGLSSEPRPQGVAKLEGAGESYRIRVGSFRVIYEVHDSQALVVILKVARRSETTYRR